MCGTSGKFRARDLIGLAVCPADNNRLGYINKMCCAGFLLKLPLPRVEPTAAAATEIKCHIRASCHLRKCGARSANGAGRHRAYVEANNPHRKPQ
jgi:hypothetical protein